LKVLKEATWRYLGFGAAQGIARMAKMVRTAFESEVRPEAEI